METGKVGTDQSHMRRLGTTSYLGHGHVTGAGMPQVAYSDLLEALGRGLVEKMEKHRILCRKIKLMGNLKHMDPEVID